MLLIFLQWHNDVSKIGRDILLYTPARTLRDLYEQCCHSGKFQLQSQENTKLLLCGGNWVQECPVHDNALWQALEESVPPHWLSHLVLSLCADVDYNKDGAIWHNKSRGLIFNWMLTLSINKHLTHSTQSGRFCWYQSSLMVGSTTRGNERKNYNMKKPHTHCQAIWGREICVVLIRLKLYQPLLYGLFRFWVLCWILFPHPNHGLKCRKNTWEWGHFLLRYNLLEWMGDLRVISKSTITSWFIKLTSKISWNISSTAQSLSVRANFCSSTNSSSLWNSSIAWKMELVIAMMIMYVSYIMELENLLYH